MKDIPEKQVVRAWQLSLLDEASFTSEDGERVEVLYPGRLNDGPGADFTDAIIARRRGKVRGDIEIHTRSRELRGHGHPRDNNYNRVVLHVVMQHDAGEITRLEDGREVPVISLSRQLEKENGETLARMQEEEERLPCRTIKQTASPATIIQYLEEAGDERFRSRAAAWDIALNRGNEAQLLYERLMEALGYSRNKEPFLELARRVPLAVLEGLGGGEDALPRQQALLLGTAGFLSNQTALAKLWASHPHPQPMPPGSWCLFKVRPNNSPPRRLAGMCYLLLRYRDAGLLEGLMSRVEQAGVGADLVEALSVVCAGREEGHSALIGRESAAVMALNVLLPCAFARGWRGRKEAAARALSLYQGFPKIAPNSIEKHMLAQFGLEQKALRAARQQQGLLQVYRERCAVGRCGDCPLAVRPGSA